MALYIVDRLTEYLIIDGPELYNNSELFIKDLVKHAEKNVTGKILEYKHICEEVQTDDSLNFLRELMPRKITVREYKALMAKKAANAGLSDDDTSDSEEEGIKKTNTPTVTMKKKKKS